MAIFEISIQLEFSYALRHFQLDNVPVIVTNKLTSVSIPLN